MKEQMKGSKGKCQQKDCESSGTGEEEQRKHGIKEKTQKTDNSDNKNNL